MYRSNNLFSEGRSACMYTVAEGVRICWNCLSVYTATGTIQQAVCRTMSPSVRGNVHDGRCQGGCSGGVRGTSCTGACAGDTGGARVSSSRTCSAHAAQAAEQRYPGLGHDALGLGVKFTFDELRDCL